MENKRWTVTLEEDTDSGDLILPIPQEILDLQGWKEGDTINIKVENGTLILSKKDG